jgi:hypothetical protein
MTAVRKPLAWGLFQAGPSSSRVYFEPGLHYWHRVYFGLIGWDPHRRVVWLKECSGDDGREECSVGGDDGV